MVVDAVVSTEEEKVVRDCFLKLWCVDLDPGFLEVWAEIHWWVTTKVDVNGEDIL